MKGTFFIDVDLEMVVCAPLGENGNCVMIVQGRLIIIGEKSEDGCVVRVFDE